MGGIEEPRRARDCPRRRRRQGRRDEPARRVRFRHRGRRALAATIARSTRYAGRWSAWHDDDLGWEDGYRLSNKAHVVFEAFNIFDAKAPDIDSFYASRLPGELADAVEDIHTHPALRDPRASVSVLVASRMSPDALRSAKLKAKCCPNLYTHFGHARRAEQWQRGHGT